MVLGVLLISEVAVTLFVVDFGWDGCDGVADSFPLYSLTSNII